MKTVIQRVKEAEVFIEGASTTRIGAGVLVFLCVEQNDTEAEADYLVEKLLNLRMFNDAEKKMNLSSVEVNAELLVISQFTLSADCKKGRRPSFDSSAKPEVAEALYKYFIGKLQQSKSKVASGVFGAMMDIRLINDGPVTFIINSK
ncbi:D-aminoacyl-tRNA deacylase [Candidatus Omnitrophota bacterium]